VLGFPRDNAHVVRRRQLFREAFNTVVFCDRRADFILAVDQSVGPEGGRVAFERVDQFERIRGQRFAIRRSTVYVYNDRDGRLGRNLLRQSVRDDHHVFFDIPTSI